ncbi:hypothetical protein DV735_g5161, partial [Chaetothyriales sp. CBS 134920]
MEFLDNEAEVSEDEDVILRRRPRKRRRMSSDSASDDTNRSSDYDLPSHDLQEDGSDIEVAGSDTDGAGFTPNRSKYGDVLHVPEHPRSHKETFVTQLSQPWSSPSHIRGPRWKRPKAPEAPAGQQKTIEESAVAQPTETRPSPAPRDVSPAGFDEFDDDDPDLLEALMASPTGSVHQQQQQATRVLAHTVNTSSVPLRQTTLFGINTTQRESRPSQPTRTHNWPLASRGEKATHHAINPDAMKTWVYPTNLGKIRDYQYNIVHKGLFHNLLVALPTGLGKTFIAATVMLNWFRWTRNAQLVFVAPTRPLVVQQAEACYGIAGIPKADTTIMTGGVPSTVRAVEWQEKRVFFMTPQTLENDLRSGIADAKRIVLLVVDEAHKATGAYSYVKVVEFLRRSSESFRVLALTATPGSKVESVQNVIDSLGIARVEIRTEDSLDIREFVHSRDTQLRVFDPSEELSMTLDLFDQVVTPVLSQLTSQNLYHERRPTNMSLYSLKMARDRWAQGAAASMAAMGLKMKIKRIFEVLMSLAHSIDLLKFHGIGPFYHKMRSFENEAGSGKYAKMIVDNEHFKKMMSYMRAWVNNPDFEGHPKLTYLKEVVLNHFLDAGEGRDSGKGDTSSKTRIMVFANFRESAEEIQRVLHRHEPIIRSHVFVGQSSTKGSGGMNQKTQLDIVNKFKSGVYNTLVATSIGEEGLDIGEVDLIVCYDSSSSPVRMLQRMGRTGRKRAGRIEVLLMRGKEENNFYKAKDNYQKMQEIIEGGTEFRFREDQSPRIVPKEIQPVVDKRIVDIPVENTQPGLPEPGKKRRATKVKKPPKKFDMPDGVDSGFSFLGGKRGTQRQEQQRSLLDRVIAPVPALEAVLMTAEQEAQFDNQYRQVSGTEPQYIQVVRFDAFPESQQKLQRTCLIGHSRYTRNITSTIRQMTDPDRDWRRPTEEEIMQSQTFGVKAVPEAAKRQYGHGKPRASNGLKSAPPEVSKRKPPTGTSETLRSSMSPGSVGEYDDKDSFIDDDLDDLDDLYGLGNNATVQRRRESSFTSPLGVDDVPNNSQKADEQPWYVPQKTVRDVSDSDDDDDELPDFGDIIGKAASVAAGFTPAIEISQGFSLQEPNALKWNMSPGGVDNGWRCSPPWPDECNGHPTSTQPAPNQLTYYTFGTPNGLKGAIALEELGLEYSVVKVDITKNEQKEAWFLAINPNGRIPALTDGNNDDDNNKLRVFESGAILLYLVDQYDHSNTLTYPHGSREYYELLSWLMWQMGGLGPMQGQANHFRAMAGAYSEYAINRYMGETRRLFDVLESRLSKADWLAGDKYTIADIASYGWVRFAPGFLDFDLRKDWPGVDRWFRRIRARPAVERAQNVPEGSMTDDYLVTAGRAMRSKVDAMKPQAVVE